MLVNESGIQSEECMTADIVVVGSGAAGIPLALSLAESGLSVLVMESGYARSRDDVQALYEGSVSNEALHCPPEYYRNRMLGGSTVIWGGRCMPFDPIDFEARAYVPESGWPFSRDELEDYYRQANYWLEAGEFQYVGKKAFDPMTPPLVKNFESDRVMTDGLERFSRPTNLYDRYLGRLRAEKNLYLVSGANCINITLSDDKSSVERMVFSTMEKKRFYAKAKHYVLATGGIEVARLLLASNSQLAGGIGNAHDLVGRYYMCHIAGNLGKLTFNGPTDDVRHNYEVTAEGIYCRRRFSLTAEEQRRLSVSNVVLRLHFPKITDPSHRNGVLSGLYLAKRFISYEYAKRLADGSNRGIATHVRHLLNILLTPIDTTKFLLHWLFKRTLSSRKFPSVILRNKTNVFSLDVHGEQIPNRNSRITLSSETDSLGVPKVNIDWQYLPQDIVSVRKTIAVLAEELDRCGVGHLEVDDVNFEKDLMRFGAYGGHHIGTARMGLNAETSVVNENCRVHEVSNLFIASSAVFPTSSQANPTLTITALALRLAHHLKMECGSRVAQETFGRGVL